MISSTFQPIAKYANTIWFLRSLENGLNLIAALFNIHPIALSLRAAYEKCWRKNDTKAKTLTRKADKALRFEVFFEALPQGIMHIRFIFQDDSLTFVKPQVSLLSVIGIVTSVLSATSGIMNGLLDWAYPRCPTVKSRGSQFAYFICPWFIFSNIVTVFAISVVVLELDFKVNRLDPTPYIIIAPVDYVPDESVTILTLSCVLVFIGLLHAFLLFMLACLVYHSFIAQHKKIRNQRVKRSLLKSFPYIASFPKTVILVQLFYASGALALFTHWILRIAPYLEQSSRDLLPTFIRPSAANIPSVYRQWFYEGFCLYAQTHDCIGYNEWRWSLRFPIFISFPPKVNFSDDPIFKSSSGDSIINQINRSKFYLYRLIVPFYLFLAGTTILWSVYHFLLVISWPLIYSKFILTPIERYDILSECLTEIIGNDEVVEDNIKTVMEESTMSPESAQDIFPAFMNQNELGDGDDEDDVYADTRYSNYFVYSSFDASTVNNDPFVRGPLGAKTRLDNGKTAVADSTVLAGRHESHDELLVKLGQRGEKLREDLKQGREEYQRGACRQEIRSQHLVLMELEVNAFFLEFFVANQRLRIARKKQQRKKVNGMTVEERKDKSFISSKNVGMELDSYQTWLKFLEESKEQRKEGIQSQNLEQLTSA